MRGLARTPLWLAVATLALLGGCGSCASPSIDSSGCGVGADGIGVEGSGGGANACGTIGCCVVSHGGAADLGSRILQACGCHPAVACASVCAADACQDGTPFPVDDACGACIIEQPLGADCAIVARGGCSTDAACSVLADCLRGVDWPDGEPTTTTSTATKTTSTPTTTSTSPVGAGGANTTSTSTP